MRGRKLFNRFYFAIKLLTVLLSLLPRSFRNFLLVLLRNLPGIIGIGMRYIFLKSLSKSCGKNIKIKSYVLLSHLENFEIGDNVSINEFCSIGCLGGVKIGSDVSIAHGTTILSTEHDFENPANLIKDAPPILKKTTIGNNVWLGTKVTITGGVNLGNNVVIGAGSVVTRNIPDNSIAVGVPAKITNSEFENRGLQP